MREEQAVLLIVVAIPWIVASILCGRACSRKGQDSAEGFIVAVFFSPIFGILYAIALPDRSREREEVDTEDRVARGEEKRRDRDRREARREGRYCKGCGFVSDFPLGDACPECHAPVR